MCGKSQSVHADAAWREAQQNETRFHMKFCTPFHCHCVFCRLLATATIAPPDSPDDVGYAFPRQNKMRPSRLSVRDSCNYASQRIQCERSIAYHAGGFLFVLRRVVLHQLPRPTRKRRLKQAVRCSFIECDEWTVQEGGFDFNILVTVPGTQVHKSFPFCCSSQSLFAPCLALLEVLGVFDCLFIWFQHLGLA